MGSFQDINMDLEWNLDTDKDTDKNTDKDTDIDIGMDNLSRPYIKKNFRALRRWDIENQKEAFIC